MQRYAIKLIKLTKRYEQIIGEQVICI